MEGQRETGLNNIINNLNAAQRSLLERAKLCFLLGGAEKASTQTNNRKTNWQRRWLPANYSGIETVKFTFEIKLPVLLRIPQIV
jgi:hypothetical protein